MSNTMTRLVSVWGLLILLVLLLAIFSALIPSTFLTAFTFQSLLNSRSINALVALAVMLPLCANQFDLSVASTLGIAQVLANGLQTQQHLPWLLAALLILVMGAAVGLINGLLVTRLHINSFIATLGSGTLLLGLNQWYTGGRQIVGILPPNFVALSGRLGNTGIPLPVAYVIVLALLLWLLLEYVPIGRYLYVIGDNPRAAELTGISVNRMIVMAFVAAGLISAFAGIILQAQLLAGQSTVGQELMLPAFTGALLGATSVRPGRPNVWGTVLAVSVLAVAVAGLSQLGAPFYIEQLFNGGMLILAVGLAMAAQRRRERRRTDPAIAAAAVATSKSSSPAG
jgi:ribose transport system permease protein